MNMYRSILLNLSVALILPHLSMAALPSVDNDGGASDILSITAVLNGNLVSTGALPTQVLVYWGDTDGETNALSWGFSADLGDTNALGLVSRYVTNLTPNQTYFYRYYATNADGEAWADASTNFQTRQSSGPSNVFLGVNESFVVLAGSAITTTGGGAVKGDAGVSPASGSFIGLTDPQVDGVIYAVDAAGPSGSVIDPTLLTTAQGDLTIAYNNARDRTPVPTGPFLNPGGGNIGGLTLVPGLYKFTSQALITGSDVTLYGGPDDVWIFQIATELIVGADVRKVILSGGALARNVYWQVGTSATLGTFSDVKGTIMADQAITIDTSAVLEGRALARIANVVFNGLSASLPADPKTLNIQSDHSSGLPAAGLYTYESGTTLTNAINGIETLGGTQFVSTGWTMTGNEPTSGLSTSMTMVITNDAVLTWTWSTNYLFDASAQPNGSVSGNSNGFYAAGSSVTVTAAPDPGFQFAGWSGNVSGPTNNPVQTVLMNQARTLVASFELRPPNTLTLTIITDHSTSQPTNGIYNHLLGTVLTNTVDGIETLGGTQFVSTGWTMTGNEPASGLSTSMTMVITNDAVLTWTWSTNYLFDASAQPNGSVSGNSNGFYAAGSSVTVTAAPDPGFQFAGWSGNVTGPTNDPVQTVLMDQARTLVASFAFNQYTLEYTAGPGGSILGTATQLVTSGADGTPVTPFPDVGYEFVQWSDLSTATPRTDVAVTGNIAVVATFALSVSPCGTVVTLGAIMERDQTGLFTGSGLTLSAVSSAPGVMSAAITPAKKLRLVALAPGNAVITVNATSSGPLQSYAFMVTVVGNPAVISSVFPPHEPWNPRFEQQITVRNTSGCDAIGLRLLFSNLSPGITVENQTGTAPSPDGRVMIEWASDFPNNSQQMLSIIYLSTGAYRPDQYPPTVEVQYILPNTEPAPAGLGAPVNVVKVIALGDGRTLLEFESIPGHSYAVQYMNEFPVGPWVHVPLILNAGANRTQWIDYGPPATSASSGARVYQVLEVFP
jgi:hypothetical protein